MNRMLVQRARCAGWVLAAAISSGCGLAHTVDRDLLADISIENKLLLFDAENDLSIAIDEKDAIHRQIRDARQDIAYAEEQYDDAGTDADRFDEKGDAEQAQIALMAQEVFDLKIVYLESYVGLLKARFDAQESLIEVALAKYELSKAKLVKKNNVRGSQDIDLEDFEEQVADYIETAREEQAYLQEVQDEVEGLRQQWLARREELEKASGGGLGSPWAEDGALWGSR